MGASRAEAAGPARGFVHRVPQADPGLHHRRDDQLRDAHATGDGEGVGAEIGEDHLDLAAIVAVDGTGRVEAGYAGFERQPGARPDLAFKALRDLHDQTGGHRETAARRNFQRCILFDCGAQIHPRRTRRLIGRKIEAFAMRQADDKQLGR